jgi:hypothetical protein
MTMISIYLIYTYMIHVINVDDGMNHDTTLKEMTVGDNEVHDALEVYKRSRQLNVTEVHSFGDIG